MKQTKPTVATAPHTPQTISVPVKLEDVQLQAGMFSELPKGRYVLEYTGGGFIQVVSVYWDGEGTVVA